jgi:GTPase SAR1 family protein
LFCSRETYNALTNWLTDARTLASPSIVIVLVGNKKDLEVEREVTFLEASRFAQEHGTYSLFEAAGSNLHFRLVHHRPHFQADFDSNSTPKLLPSIHPQTLGLVLSADDFGVPQVSWHRSCFPLQQYAQ